MERRAKSMADREGREYVPVTERGAVVHAARQAREAFRDMRERLDIARETYGAEREAGQGRVSAGLAALRAAASKERGAAASHDIRERLASITARDGPEREEPELGVQSDEERDRPRNAQERLREALDKDRRVERDAGTEDGQKPSIRERLDDVLNKPRERLEIEDESQKDREAESEKEIDREVDRDRGLGH